MKMAGADSSMAMAPDDFVDGNSALFQRRRELQRQLAELDVHTKGKAVVSHGTREEMERDTLAMQGYGLWATFERDD
jgi:ATP-dependent Clp protease adapter protein ClpS